MSVGPGRGAVQRPGDGRDFTEIFQRLDDLERGRAGGLQFNAGTYGPENVGDWLVIETTTGDSPNSYGIEVLTNGYAWNIDLAPALGGAGGNFHIVNTSEFDVTTDDGSDTSEFFVRPDQFFAHGLGGTSAPWEINVDGNDGWNVYTDAGAMQMASGSFLVDIGGLSVLQIDSDGTVHIQTGKTVVADL